MGSKKQLTKNQWENLLNTNNGKNIIKESQANYLVGTNALSNQKLPLNSNRWELIKSEMKDNIISYQKVSDIIEYAQTCGFDHRVKANIHNLLQYRAALKYEYMHFADKVDQFSDSIVSLPWTLHYVNENQVSNTMYFHMFYILSILSYKPKVSRICEIGGGYGAVARLWFHNPIINISNYTIIDLPESLFYAEVFLKTACPKLNIQYCKHEEDLQNREDNTVYLVPIELANQTTNMNFDVIVNTGSLAELSDEWVHFWSDWLGYQSCDFFYSHNYFGVAIDRLYESRNIVAPIPPKNWRTVRTRINHPLMILQSKGRNAAEIFIEKSHEQQPDWIYKVMLFKKVDKLYLADLAYFIFNLPELAHIDVQAEFDLVTKAVTDLHFKPKELLYLLNRIEKSDPKTKLSSEDHCKFIQLTKTLRDRYQTAYPEGKFFQHG